MHGLEWLSNPLFSIILLGIGFLFLWMALRIEKEHRRYQHDSAHSGIEIKFMEKKVIDTSIGWLFFPFLLEARP